MNWVDEQMENKNLSLPTYLSVQFSGEDISVMTSPSPAAKGKEYGKLGQIAFLVLQRGRTRFEKQSCTSLSLSACDSAGVGRGDRVSVESRGQSVNTPTLILHTSKYRLLP